MTNKAMKYLLFPAVGLNLLLTLLALTLSLFLTSLLCLAVLVTINGPPLSPATLEVINNSGATVCEVYISAIDYSDWGGDWLDNRLSPGETLNFDVTEGHYDILLIGCNQQVLFETYNIPVTGWHELHIDRLPIGQPLEQVHYSSSLRNYPA